MLDKKQQPLLKRLLFFDEGLCGLLGLSKQIVLQAHLGDLV
jgi:hypothetical protein